MNTEKVITTTILIGIPLVGFIVTALFFVGIIYGAVLIAKAAINSNHFEKQEITIPLEEMPDTSS